MPTQHVGTDVDDLCHDPTGTRQSAVSENLAGPRATLLSRFYWEGRLVGLGIAQLEALREDVYRAGRDGRARRLTPIGVDRRVVRKTLEAFGVSL